MMRVIVIIMIGALGFAEEERGSSPLDEVKLYVFRPSVGVEGESNLRVMLQSLESILINRVELRGVDAGLGLVMASFIGRLEEEELGKLRDGGHVVIGLVDLELFLTGDSLVRIVSEFRDIDPPKGVEVLSPEDVDTLPIDEETEKQGRLPIEGETSGK